MRPSHQHLVASLALVLAAVLTTGLVACNKKEAAPADQGGAAPANQAVRFVGADLGRAVGGDRSITDATHQFGPNDTIYVSVETDGSAAAATVAARWTYQDGQEVDRSETTIAPSGTEHTEFHVSNPDGWPAGNYQVEIMLDGRTVETLDFAVES
jgi:hypothetical protein